MKIYFSQVASQATAILLAALAAGAIAFFQSVATQSGACNIPGTNPAEIGILGGAFKGLHSIFTKAKFIV